MIDWSELFIRVFIGILLVVAAVVCVGLFVIIFVDSSTKEEAPDGTSKSFYSFSVEAKTVRGHDYLVFIHGNGISALHAASCPCHTQK